LSVLVGLALGAPAAASGRGYTPEEVAQAAIHEAHPRLDRCVKGRALRAAVRLRLRRGGSAEVVRILGVSDPQARACLKVVIQGLLFGERIGAEVREVVLAMDLGGSAGRGDPASPRRMSLADLGR
jgi:hypothetical protein